MARILLVDDTETYLQIERSALGPSHEYLAARNGQEAIRAARESLPDLILMDVAMPLISGLEAMRILKADPTTESIPVLVVTADESHQAEARSLGGADFVRKPFDSADLLRRANRILAAAHLARSALLVALGGRPVAIPLDHVAEVVAMPQLSPLLGAPRQVRGLLNLRGEPVPVLDVMRRLNVPSRANEVDQFVVIAEQEGRWLGLCVDDAQDVVEIERGSFVPGDVRLAGTFGSLRRALIGTWRREGELVAVLSPFKLVPEATLKRITASLAAAAQKT